MHDDGGEGWEPVIQHVGLQEVEEEGPVVITWEIGLFIWFNYRMCHRGKTGGKQEGGEGGETHVLALEDVETD